MLRCNRKPAGIFLLLSHFEQRISCCDKECYFNFSRTSPKLKELWCLKSLPSLFVADLEQT